MVLIAICEKCGAEHDADTSDIEGICPNCQMTKEEDTSDYLWKQEIRHTYIKIINIIQSEMNRVDISQGGVTTRYVNVNSVLEKLKEEMESE